jgi:phosphatidyl-myo-inositol alpha-mannosyltransferase
VTAPLRIAVVSPHAWPPRDDIAYDIAAEAAALAARGHHVTILAPASGRERIAAGRSRLRAAEAGDPGALVAERGEVLEVAVARALPTGPGRRLGGPFDLDLSLEAALSTTPFDVVHLHEPLAPSPALAALRHSGGLTAATFHRAEPLVGVAFLRPLVDRALARVDLRIATTHAGRRALAEILPGEYEVVPPGVDVAGLADPGPEPEGAPGLLLVARGRDRAGVRFALGVLRDLDLDLGAIGPVTVLGPPDAPWRTRATVPKALREIVTVVPDAGPEARAELLRTGGRIVLLATPEDAAGPVAREAMAAGRAIVAARCPAIEEVARHGVEALILPPFTREAWGEAVTGLATDPARRAELSERAAERGRARSWDDVARELEGGYRIASVPARRGAADSDRVLADLRVRPGAELDAPAIVAACRRRGVGVVGVAAPGGIEPALAVAGLAPADLAVVVGQEIATADGVLVGLFLSRDVPEGLTPEEAAAAVHDQGGVVMVPHPDASIAPSPGALRRLAGAIDCHEVLTAVTDGAGDEGAAQLARRLGLLGCAGSGAERPEQVGSAVTELRPFHDPSDFLEALAGARVLRQPRAPRGREARPRRRGRRRPES